MSSDYKRDDRLYRKAKEEGYRSRAAYKLIEINERFKIIRPGDRILDLGAWPGGWLQVASKLVGEQGQVVGIDLVAIDSIGAANTHTIQGDAREEENIEKCFALAGGKFAAVLSDMSPKLTGIKEADRVGATACAALALFIAEKTLAQGGCLVTKVFKSQEAEQFVKTARPMFNKTTRSELDSTRTTSNEFYVIFTGFRGSA